MSSMRTSLLIFVIPFIIILVLYFLIPLCIYGTDYDLDELGHLRAVKSSMVFKHAHTYVLERPSYYLTIQSLYIILGMEDKVIHLSLSLALILLIIISCVMILRVFNLTQMAKKYDNMSLLLFLLLFLLSNYVCNYHVLPYVYALALSVMFLSIVINRMINYTTYTLLKITIFTLVLIYISIVYSHILFALFLWLFLMISVLTCEQYNVRRLGKYLSTLCALFMLIYISHYSIIIEKHVISLLRNIISFFTFKEPTKIHYGVIGFYKFVGMYKYISFIRNFVSLTQAMVISAIVLLYVMLRILRRQDYAIIHSTYKVQKQWFSILASLSLATLILSLFTGFTRFFGIQENLPLSRIIPLLSFTFTIIMYGLIYVLRYSLYYSNIIKLSFINVLRRIRSIQVLIFVLILLSTISVIPTVTLRYTSSFELHNYSIVAKMLAAHNSEIGVVNGMYNCSVIDLAFFEPSSAYKGYPFTSHNIKRRDVFIIFSSIQAREFSITNRLLVYNLLLSKALRERSVIFMSLSDKEHYFVMLIF